MEGPACAHSLDARSVQRAPRSKRTWSSSAADPPGSRWRSRWRKRGFASCCWRAAARNTTPPRKRSTRATRPGVKYLPLDASRQRVLGGSTTHWGGWCRPLDKIDFTARDWLPHSGWPFGRDDNRALLSPRASARQEAGPFIYDNTICVDPTGSLKARRCRSVRRRRRHPPDFQFSKQTEDVLPTNPTRRALRQHDLKNTPNLTLVLEANFVTDIRLSADAGPSSTISTWRPLHGPQVQGEGEARSCWLAAGGVETPRILLRRQ